MVRKWISYVVTLLLAFWAGGVTNVLLWAHAAFGKLTPDLVYNTMIWPWYAIRYVCGF